MRLRFNVVSLLLVLVLLTGSAFAQTVTGLVDGNYGWNFNHPTSRTNSVRAFDVNEQQFSLNYGELSIEQKPKKTVGYRFDFGFGDTVNAVNAAGLAAGDDAQYKHIQQAYVTVKHNDFLIDFGKFVTPLGAEVIETKDNWNYSRGLLFNYAVPFYHFGIRATYSPNDKTTLAAYVVNGWNNVHDNNRGKSVGFMATLKPLSNLTYTQNYLFGNESPVKDNRRHTFDSILTYDLNKQVSGMANYDYEFDTSFSTRRRLQGIAVYGKISPNGKDTGLKIVPRYEWLDDKSGGFTGIKQRIQEGTVTLQAVTKESGTLWLEYRRDFSSKQIFLLQRTGLNRPRTNQDTVEVGYTYSFTKEIK